MEYFTKYLFLFLLFSYGVVCRSQSVQSIYYKVDKKEIHHSDKHNDITIAYPILTSETHSDIVDTINKFLYNEFVPTEHILHVAETTNDVDEQEEDDDGYASEQTSFSIELSTNKYLCLAKNYSADMSGAAHGSWWSDYYHFDMETGKQLEFNDLFDDEIYNVIRKTILTGFPDLPKAKTDTFDAHNLTFKFYFSMEDCEDSEGCLVLYFAPYTTVGNLVNTGSNGLYYTFPANKFAPYAKHKWRAELLR